MTNEQLISHAIEARKKAYAPYSHFKVGAALLLKNGEVITGCNIENASYGATNCAERTAIFKAVSEGKKDFQKLAIVGGHESEVDIFSDFAFPCGICRQVINEFCDKDFIIITAKSISDYKETTLNTLLPESFGKNVLN